MLDRLETLEGMVQELKVWNEFKLNEADGSYEVYRGIDKNYYSKWIGFRMIDEEKDFEEVDKAAIDFYITYYYYQLKLDMIEDKLLEFVILNFAVMNGKKKAIEKLQRITGFEVTGKTSTKLMEYINRYKAQLTPLILLEYIEFFYYTESLLKSGFLLKAYRQFSRQGTN